MVKFTQYFDDTDIPVYIDVNGLYYNDSNIINDYFVKLSCIRNY